MFYDLHFEGLQLFGKALQDVYDTLIQCGETAVAEKLEKFIADLISCTECKLSILHITFSCIYCIANCVNFLIDIGLEILVLYERIYEIYGDIYGAKNCFEIDAYEMGNIL